jgi:hypothetical protein
MVSDFDGDDGVVRLLLNAILVGAGSGLVIASLFEKFNSETWFHEFVIGLLLILAARTDVRL